MPTAKDILLDCPIIAAVKNDSDLEEALRSECQIVFLLYGNLVTVDALVQKIRQRKKLAIVHMDLIDGLSSREIAVDGLAKLCRPDGIISTRAAQIRRARQLGLLTVQRAFILDSLSLESLGAQLEAGKPDFVEILPGIMPRILREITEKISVPLIAGGLIQHKQEVLQALDAGAVAVSTTCRAVWNM